MFRHPVVQEGEGGGGDYRLSLISSLSGVTMSYPMGLKKEKKKEGDIKRIIKPMTSICELESAVKTSIFKCVIASFQQHKSQNGGIVPSKVSCIVF